MSSELTQEGELDLSAAPASGEQRISEETDRLMQESTAYNTRRAYASMLKQFDAWLDGRDVNDLSIANYIAHMKKSGKAVATARLALAAIRSRAKRNGQRRPDGLITATAMEGYGRSSRNRGRGQVRGIEWEQADAISLVAARSGGLAGLRDAAVISVMSDCLLRISEAAAVTVEHVRPEEDGTGRLLVPHSKTDQEGRGTDLYLRAFTMRRVSVWTAAAGIRSGPLFLRVRKGGKVQTEPLSAVSIRAIIQRWAKAAGVTGRVSGHSLRVGAAQSLMSAGATLPQLQQAGRWLSPDMPARYARRQLAGKSAVARLRPDS